MTNPMKPRHPEDLSETISKLKHLLKRGDFGDDLKDLSSHLSHLLASPECRAADKLNCLIAKNMLIEIHDYFGSEFPRSLSSGLEHGDDVPVLVPDDPLGRQVVREQLRLRMNNAHAVLYRRHEYEAAKRELETCHKYILENLCRNPDSPCDSTLAQCCQYLGQVHRQLAEYSKAADYFSKAVAFWYQHASRSQSNLEKSYASYRSAIVLALGIGWLNYTQGRLSRALNENIIPARVVLLQSGDVINKAYANLVLGSIKRCLSRSSDNDTLREVIELVREAHGTFKSEGQRRYQTRAAFELALTYFSLRLYADAEAQLDEVDTFSMVEKDSRWQGNSLVVRSRIKRNQEKLVEAERLANEALQLAKENNETLTKIDARISRGEIKAKLQRFNEARMDWERALSDNKVAAGSEGSANPKIEAICIIHIGLSYVAQRKEVEARPYLESWKKLRNLVDHGFVQESGLRLEKALEEFEADFVVRSRDALRKTYAQHKRNLQDFLVRTARLKPGGQSDRASALKVTRQTFARWEKAYDLRKKRRAGD